MKRQLAVTLCICLILISCGDKTNKKSKKGKGRITTIKKARSIIKDPCESPGNCTNIVELDIQSADDANKYPQFFPKKLKTVRDLKPGDSITHSVLELLTPTKIENGIPLGRYCYVLYENTRTFVEIKNNLIIDEGEVEKDSLVDVAFYKNTISNWRPIMNDDFCQQEADKVYKTRTENYYWIWDTDELESADKKNVFEVSEGIDLKDFKFSALKYKGNPALRTIGKVKEKDEKENRHIATWKINNLNLIGDQTSYGLIYQSYEGINSSQMTTHHTSELFLKKFKQEVNPDEIPLEKLGYSYQ